MWKIQRIITCLKSPFAVGPPAFIFLGATKEGRAIFHCKEFFFDDNPLFLVKHSGGPCQLVSTRSDFFFKRLCIMKFTFWVCFEMVAEIFIQLFYDSHFFPAALFLFG